MIAAEAPVSASAREVFAFLADLENHWLLTGPLVRVIHLSGPAGARDGGTIAEQGACCRVRLQATVEGY